MGIEALRESSSLQDARSTMPASHSTLANEASLTQTYSIIADALTAAAVVVGGITLISTLSAGHDESSGERSSHSARFVLGPGSAAFDVSF
jgi:hypothetical protein